VREGVFADAAEAVARCVRVRGVVEPVWDYEAGYARFRELYPTLKALNLVLAEGETRFVS
jgi:hypothetical protein